MDATNGNGSTQRERQSDDLAARIADHLLSRPTANALMTPQRDPHAGGSFVTLGKMGDPIPLNQHNDFVGYTKAMRTAAGKAGMHRHHVTSGTSTNVAIDKSEVTLMTLQYELFNDYDIEQSNHSATSAGTSKVAAALNLRLGKFTTLTPELIFAHTPNFGQVETTSGAHGPRHLTTHDFISRSTTRTGEEREINEATRLRSPQPNLRDTKLLHNLRIATDNMIVDLHEGLAQTLAKLFPEET